MGLSSTRKTKQQDEKESGILIQAKFLFKHLAMFLRVHKVCGKNSPLSETREDENEPDFEETPALDADLEICLEESIIVEIYLLLEHDLKKYA